MVQKRIRPECSEKSISDKPAKNQLSIFDALPDSAFIRESQLVQSPKRPNTPAPLPFSAPTLWRKVKAGTFPRPIKLSERVTCWHVGTIRAWVRAQEALVYNPVLIGKNARRTKLVTS